MGAELQAERESEYQYELSKLCGYYLTDLEPRIKRNTFLTKKHIIETKILPYFGKRKLDDIRTSDVIQWQNEIMKLKKDNVARKAGTMGKEENK